MDSISDPIATTWERRKRREEAIAAVLALSEDDQDEVLAAIHAQRAEKKATPKKRMVWATPIDVSPKPAATSKPETPKPQTGKPPSAKPQTFVEKAEAFVLGLLPGVGVGTAEVAKAIGQKTRNAYQSLMIAAKNGRIEYRNNLWYAVATPRKTVVNGAPRAPKAPSIRELAVKASKAAERGLGAEDIARAVCEADPSKKHDSAVAEVHRMVKDGLYEPSGTNGRGSLFVLTPKGGAVLNGSA